MFGTSGILFSTDFKNGSPIPIEASSNLVIFSVSNISDPNWASINYSNTLIKARDSNYVDVGTLYLTPTNLPTLSFTTGTNNSHNGVDYPEYSNSQMSPLIGGKGFRGYPAGSHNHSIDINLNNQTFLPPHIKIILYKRTNNSSPFYSLPIGSLIFGENLNISGLTATSTYDNKYICCTPVGNQGTTGGSSSFSFSFITGYSGEHYHDGPVNNSSQTGFNGTGYGERSGSIELSTGQSHLHTGSVTLTHKKQYVKLRTYQVTDSNVFISSGMIFGFTSAIDHPDWFCCNGQTARGYVTPNLVNRYIMCGNNNISSHNVNPSALDDLNILNVDNYTVDTNLWNHTHGIENQFYQNTGTRIPQSRYHTYSNVPHTHSMTGQSTTISYEPNHFNLIFYIYLP